MVLPSSQRLRHAGDANVQRDGVISGFREADPRHEARDGGGELMFDGVSEYMSRNRFTSR